MSAPPKSKSPPGVRPLARRGLFFCIVPCLMLAAVGLVYYFWFSFPVGSGPAGPRLDASWFSAVWSTNQVMMVGLGDSVTDGFGARKGYGYFDRLVAPAPEDSADLQGLSLTKTLPNLQATNLAVSGSVSSACLEKQLPLLPVFESNVVGLVVITTGGNDLIHNYGRTPPAEEAMYGAAMTQAGPWVANFKERLEKIVEELNGRFPGGCQIFLANIYDPTDGVGDIKRAGLPPWPDGLGCLAAYNDMIRDCAERHANVHLVDFHGNFLGHGLHCTQFWSRHYRSADPHYWYYGNLEDPNERGYDAIRRLFLTEIARVRDRF